MPAVGTSPYDSADYVLNVARSLGNDAIRSLAGNLLADSVPATQVFLNTAYRHLQRKLGNAGYGTFKKTLQVLGLTPATPIDPGTRVILSYTGYFDGTTNYPTPVLPPDLCWPLRLRERRNGTTNAFQDMAKANDGLESRRQLIYLGDWDYEGDAIVMNGSSQINDLELYYTPFLPDLSITTTPVSQVLILRSENALAAYTLWRYALARGSALAVTIQQMGDMFLKDMLTSDAATKSRQNFRRRGYSAGLHSGWGRV